jgi:hypothetical protein
MEPTWVEKSTADTVREHILLEPGLASTASGSERGQEQSFIWSEETEGQKERNIQPTLMVGMDHSKLSSNTSKQTASEDDLADSAKREGSETSRARKVANTPPLHLMLAHVSAEDCRCNAVARGEDHG